MTLTRPAARQRRLEARRRRGARRAARRSSAASGSRSRRDVGDPPRRGDDRRRADRARAHADHLRAASCAPSRSSVALRGARIDRRGRRARCRRAPTRRAPATNSAAPALSSTTSRGGAGCAVEHARGRSRRSPPRRRPSDRPATPSAARSRPGGRRTCAPRRRGTPTPWCSRSSRSRRCRRRRARPTPASSPSSSSARASSSVSSGRGTPTICRVAPAGLVSGPSRLNAVRMPSSRRVGAACFIDGWNVGAKKNAMLASCSVRSTTAGGAATLHAELLEDVGAAAAARHRSVAVLGHLHAARRDHQRRRRRDVEGARAIAAGAAGVEHLAGRRRQLHRVLAHRPREADDLGRPLALHRQRGQQRRRAPPARRAPSMTSRMAAGGLVLGEVLVAHELLDQRGEASAESRKLRRMRRPSSVSTDSGWNCTPCTG